MQTAEIPNTLSARFGGRMDATFLMYAQQHLGVVDELVKEYTLDQLKELALKLPPAEDGGKILPSAQYTWANNKFNKRILAARLKNATVPDVVAVYVAVALDGLAKKVLTEVEKQARELRDLTAQLKDYYEAVPVGKTPLARALLSSGLNDEKVPEVIVKKG